MAVIFGRNTFVVPGLESTYGSAGSYNTNANKVISTTLARSQQRDGRSSLSTSDGAIRKGFYDTFEETGGNLTIPVCYDGIGTFLKCMVGTVTTSSLGGPDYLHEYKSNTTDLDSFSLKLQRGSDSTSGREDFLGLKVSTASISVEAGGEMTLSMELIGKTADARTTGITGETFSTAEQVYHYEGSTLTFNGVSYNIRSLNLNIDNKLSRRNVLGSRQTLSPDVTDFREATMQVDLDLEDNNLYNAMLNKTESTLTCQFTQEGSTNFIELQFLNSIITDYDDSISTVGRITRSVTFTALAGASSEALRISVRNTNSSGTDNP
tara:strand:+ start:11813 stop:12778 length:966 start_codon:yes stop_codon:yes gene_type:complete